MMEPTYKALIRPVPLRLNLANASTQVASKTCQLCGLFVPNKSKAKNNLIRTPYERIDIYPDFPELNASAKAGCGLCRLVRKTIRSNWAIRPMEEWGVGPLSEKDNYWDDLFTSTWDRRVRIYNASFSISTFEWNLQAPLDVKSDGIVVGLSMEFGPLNLPPQTDELEEHGDISQVIRFKVFDQQDLEASKEEHRRRLPHTDTLSPANITMLSQWINDCKSSHAACQFQENSWLPTRLLDVGPVDGSEIPRLVEASSDKVQGGYAALSHMWGDMSNQPPLRTLKSNYGEMTKGIYMTSLPKNFAQAVIVTRRLNLRYLWIDSLCIIQDHPDDWRKEAGTMHQVYQYAEVTIVATSALSTHDGFLERTLPLVPAVKIEYTLDTSPDGTKTMILAAQDDQETGIWSGDVDGSTWNTRGWTLQERSLSTRSIHFCKNKTYFECRSCRRSEENEPFAEYRPFSMWPRNEDWLQGPHSIEADALRQEKLYNYWISTVTNYTSRSLTKGSDKLPAIQSTASQLESTLKDNATIHAGMWMDKLKSNLMWQVGDGPTSRPREFRAPTWSWASLDAKIHWKPVLVEPNPELGFLNDASFGPFPSSHSVSPLGSRGGNILKVKGFLQALAFIDPVDEDDRWINFSRAILPYDLYIRQPSDLETDKQNQPNMPLEARYYAIEQGRVVKFAEGRLDLDNKDNLAFSSKRLYYLHISSRTSPSGLILEAGEGSDRIFSRVGIASIFVYIEEKRKLIYSNAFQDGCIQTEVEIS